MTFNTRQSRRWFKGSVAVLLALLVVTAPGRADDETSDDLDPPGIETIFSMAVWAGSQGLDEQADQLNRMVLERDADHEGARRAIRQVRLRGRWMDADDALTVCGESIDDGDANEQILTCLDDLLAIAESAAQQQQIRRTQAFAAICRKQFTSAGEAMAGLIPLAPADQRPKLEATAELLAAHRDGLYVITAEHLVGAALLGDADAALPPGPCSLADPAVLRIALTDKAGDTIEVGVGMLKQARKTRAADPDQAEELCVAALENFEWADAVVDGIARSYRIEAARVLIDVVRTRIEAGAVQFDAELKAIGRRDLTVDAYVGRLQRMADCLVTVKHDLDTILEVAGPYPRELAVVIRWAQADRQRIGRMQRTLAQELDEAR